MDTIFIFGAQYLYLFIIGLALFYFFIQPTNKRTGFLSFSLINMSLAYLIASIARYFYFNPRPFVVDHVVPLITHAPDNGFPSDHMLLSSALASVLFYYNRKLGAVAWILALIVGVSRVYVGIHHLADIFGSALIAISVAYITFYIFRNSKLNY
ncbi:MAG: Phosphoesterase PA-phosphatase related protein [Candidatus Magasanikbacteria bacterium GW2011_GWD2_43_18]|uniref:Phosphatidic acid phosphatase type 2/haloperoxidase domain-containing protein n=2 Tax=Parcubacteria group TaxID=1794811 RepID=A0A1F5BJ02_9BACT|nr:MAG: Phosphoesterase PA-phosphatase related protein [Candidatus Magasanikbacteria bacterium GW2011_GWE2_42_7]KKT04539.1 MAG: Phosphoesterase PA-phosphatase related protein [Candidatus Magasanikbacteria bacterium GW2011_GWD2_43_18]OGD30566.1 MAG: hypothetical protein A2W60_00160 [Candidatus Azambacteria bacterium RIFCSPHIGHO2_02_46_12]OGY11115.1 MAG: hypothetical protein A3E16_01700 [Candidatus Blackburnbacteria bacterium RIFCSPHIGHO2_12_FULL_44_25]HCC13760.1 hypothetical protein [Candidatus 